MQRVLESNDADADVTSLDVELVCENGGDQFTRELLLDRCLLLADAVEINGDDQVDPLTSELDGFNVF